MMWPEYFLDIIVQKYWLRDIFGYTWFQGWDFLGMKYEPHSDTLLPPPIHHKNSWVGPLGTGCKSAQP